MAGKDRWGSVFSKAKTWVDKKVEENTTADARKSDRLQAESAELQREMRSEAQMNAIRQAIPGLDRALDHQEERRDAATVERDARQRAARVEAFDERSWLQLDGAVAGRIDGLAVRREDWGGNEQISLEAVDPVPVSGGAFEVLTFVIPSGLAVGQHDLAVGYESSEGFELYVGQDESFAWCPDYGVGIVAVDPDGSLRFAFAMQNSGSEQVNVSGVLSP